MKLEKQVCSLELAKKLKKLGMKQDSIFYYVDGKVSYKVSCSPVKMMEEDGYLVYSAFTVAELGEMLPPDSRQIKELGEKFWTVGYADCTPFAEENEADARAKLLIQLIKNKKVTL